MYLNKKLERLKKKVEVMENGCVLWTGAKVKGLPVIRDGKKLKTAVRYLFQQFFPTLTIVEGARCLNICGTKNCVNFKHWSIPYKGEAPEYWINPWTGSFREPKKAHSASY